MQKSQLRHPGRSSVLSGPCISIPRTLIPLSPPVGSVSPMLPFPDLPTDIPCQRGAGGTSLAAHVWTCCSPSPGRPWTLQDGLGHSKATDVTRRCPGGLHRKSSGRACARVPRTGPKEQREARWSSSLPGARLTSVRDLLPLSRDGPLQPALRARQDMLHPLPGATLQQAPLPQAGHRLRFQDTGM